MLQATRLPWLQRPFLCRPCTWRVSSRPHRRPEYPLILRHPCPRSRHSRLPMSCSRSRPRVRITSCSRRATPSLSSTHCPSNSSSNSLCRSFLPCGPLSLAASFLEAMPARIRRLSLLSFPPPQLLHGVQDGSGDPMRLVLNFARKVDILPVFRQLECVAPQVQPHGQAGGTVREKKSFRERRGSGVSPFRVLRCTIQQL